MSVETNIAFWKTETQNVFCGIARPVNTGWAIPPFLILMLLL